MIRILRRSRAHPDASRGFSLLEVLIAVVVLSVGLLALAALQGRLTQASSEAKVRGRVAAMLSARMDALRSGGYGTINPGAFNSTTANACGDAADAEWLDCTREEAGLSALSATQTVATWYGDASFATPPPVPQDARVAQFKRVTVVANWADAAGGAHSLELVTDVSSMALTSNIVVPPDPTDTGNGGPIVRTASPATEGVVPIAMSMNSTSATSNPVPELVGRGHNQKIVGTRFSVLNYAPAYGEGVIIQKRFENEVVKCSCQYGAGGTNLPEIYRTAMWPAVWNGDKYAVADPDGDGDAPGQLHSPGPDPDAEQSALCQECCRDHHDTNESAVKFDPEREGHAGWAKYQSNGGVLTPQNDTTGGEYVDSCRLIRVDGFWRTASDLYARQFNMLETEEVGGVAAKSGLPKQSSVDAYTTQVKNYLHSYDGTAAQSPLNGSVQGTFDSALATPSINIATASPTDYRYLHVRALYVDYLEEEAREKLVDVIGDADLCPDGGTSDCMLPYLPFTTANLTEIAGWTKDPTDSSVLTVNDANLLATDPEQPFGGRTIGSSNGNADTVASVSRSNSGVAVSDVLDDDTPHVDEHDSLPANQSTDAQSFEVGGPSGGPTFDVQVAGGGANPFVFYTLGGYTNIECLKPSGTLHHCVTGIDTTLPQSGTLRIANYWFEDTETRSVTATCGNRTATAVIPVPRFHNFIVSGALNNGVAGTISAPVNDAKITEYTDVIFGSIAQGSLSVLTLTEEVGSPQYATIASCQTNGQGTTINKPVWNKPWTQP